MGGDGGDRTSDGDPLTKPRTDVLVGDHREGAVGPRGQIGRLVEGDANTNGKDVPV